MVRRQVRLGGAALGVWLGIVGAAAGQESDGAAAVGAIEDAFVRAIERAEASVVSVHRIKPNDTQTAGDLRRQALIPHPNFANPIRDPAKDPDNPEYIPLDFGSGVIYDVNRTGTGTTYIVTNYHVVKGGPIEGRPRDGSEFELHVRLPNRRDYQARILAADPRSDLAMIVIDETDVQPIRLGDASRIRKGQIVIALGNPYATARDGSASASWGIVGNVGRQPQPLPLEPNGAPSREQTIHHLGNLLQVDVKLPIGASGGALLNLRGELIGLTTSLAALAGYEKSGGFAIPVDEATQRIFRTLREGKEVEYGFLGVSLRGSAPPVRIGFVPPDETSQGVEVQQVFENSPARLGGVEQGDQILAVNDARIHTQSDLTREVGKIAPGEMVRLLVRKHNRREPVTCETRLGKWPVIDDEGIVATQRRFEPWQGIVVDFPTARFRFGRLESQGYPQAVVITELVPLSSAAAADLSTGDFISHVNGTLVETPQKFYDAVAGLKGNVTLTVVVPTERGDPRPRSRKVQLRAP